MPEKKVLFLCTGNSCRSQMAEGFANHLRAQGVRFYSAGTEPKVVHPLAIEVMKEAGIDISSCHSKGLEAVPLEQIDLVITLCGEAAEACPVFPGKTQRMHWPLPDPAQAKGSEDELLKIFREVRDEIRARVKSLDFPQS